MTRKVIVGASCSGKSTYAWDNRADDDLVVDFDRIAGALGNTKPHDSSGLIGEATFRARLSTINTALERDENSWIIHGNPSAEQIDEYVDAGAEFVLLDPGLDECLARADAEDRPDGTEANIRAWYDDPPVFPDKATVTTITDTTEAHMHKIQARAAASSAQQRGANRYWGSVAPAKTKSEFFDAITTPAPTGDGTVATIRMYGPIDSWGGWWGVSAGDVSEVLDGLPESVTQIILRINSPGGEVFEAMAILNMLRAHKATVTGVVDGLAASAASVIAAGCDDTVMSPGTQMMIHSPLSWTYGNAEELRKLATTLDSIQGSIIDIYQGKAGDADWAELLAAETWYTAAQAVTAGLADRVAVIKDAGETSTAGAEEDPDELDPLEGDSVDDLFAAARARLTNHPIAATAARKPPSSTEPGNPNQKEALAMSDALKAGLSARLGVTDAEISDEALLAAVDEVLAEQTDTPAASAATIPAGTQIIEDNILEQMRADAAAGREARDQQIKDRRDRIISDALNEGRITAASKEQFRALLDADEDGTTQVLASMAKNTVPVTEIGHADAKSVEDTLMAQAGWSTANEEAR